MTELEKIGIAAKKAERVLSVAETKNKNDALEAIRIALIKNKDRILNANAIDIAEAEKTGVKKSFLDRLFLTSDRIDGIAKGISDIISLPDPIGEVISMAKSPNGMTIGKRRVPLGVIGIIYESRPNVTVDAAALCLKSGNVSILRGGKEAINSNSALVDIMREALKDVGLPEDCICLVRDTSRDSAKELMGLRDYINVLIPRGGAGLIRTVVENARVPVIETGTGVCHVYVDDNADLNMAANIVENAKCSRPSVCNAIETLLINEAVAEKFLSIVLPRLQKYNVELRGDEKTLNILGNSAKPADDSDWETEYNDYILSIKIVSGIDEAIEHIDRYGSGHSEAIVTNDYLKSQRFLNEVDAAAVYINASTRYTDGGEFGLGAEIGISTQKMHARGPMGLRELTSCKYVIYGSGQIR